MADLVLYRFFDADGGLLYIGKSVRAWERFSAHHQSVFFPHAALVTLQRGFASEKSLADAEIQAIRKESPRFNVVHKVKPKPKPKPRRGWIESDNARDRRISDANIPNPCGKPHYCGPVVHVPHGDVCRDRDLSDIKKQVPRIDRDRSAGAHGCWECPADAEIVRLIERRRRD